MAIALALVISTLLLRWQRFGAAVYPIADALAKRRQTHPWQAILLALVVSLLVWLVSGVGAGPLLTLDLKMPGQTLVALAALLLLFAGRPLRADGADDLPAQAERLGRSIRRYFVPLPLIAVAGIWGILALWWLRFAPLPARQRLNHGLNLGVARMVSVHFSLVRQSRQSLQSALVPAGQGSQSLYGWSLQWLARTQDELQFSQMWKTLVLIRWQWLVLAILISLWLR